MKKTLLIIAAILLASALHMAYQWQRAIEIGNIEATFRFFTDSVSTGQTDTAYGIMASDYRKTRDISAFRQVWCNPSNIIHMTAVRNWKSHKVYVTQLNLLTGWARIVTTTADIRLPLFLEDGLIAVIVDMKKENGGWVLSGPVDTLMR